jgi:hypothetical protein
VQHKNRVFSALDNPFGTPFVARCLSWLKDLFHNKIQPIRTHVIAVSNISLVESAGLAAESGRFNAFYMPGDPKTARGDGSCPPQTGNLSTTTGRPDLGQGRIIPASPKARVTAPTGVHVRRTFRTNPKSNGGDGAHLPRPGGTFDTQRTPVPREEEVNPAFPKAHATAPMRVHVRRSRPPPKLEDISGSLSLEALDQLDHASSFGLSYHGELG